MAITADDNFSVDFVLKDNNFSEDTFSGCLVCAENHKTEKCSVFDNLIQIQDTKVPPRAFLTLPLNLKIESLADGSKTVIATERFVKGTQFGPFQAKHLYAMNPFDAFPLKVFGDSENILPDCYLDTGNEEQCNWMCYVAPAQNCQEQNLICYQLKLDIYYSVIRDVEPGDQLRVWYSSYYARKMGMDVYDPTENVSPTAEHAFNSPSTDYLHGIDPDQIQRIAEKLPASKLGAEDKQNWTCRMCGYMETHVVPFAKHLQKHYLKMINTLHVCDICNEGYSSEKCLLKHKRVAHLVLSTKTAEMEELINKQPQPLLEPEPDPDPDADPEQEQLLLLDQLPGIGLYNELNDVDTLRAILCEEPSSQKMANRIAQEKSIADFSLDLVAAAPPMPPPPPPQPPYTCDICAKPFQTLPYLVRHLKKHTGEFTCVHCLVVFTRKENYLRHPCLLTSDQTVFNCTFCPKWFIQKKYLRRHVTRHLRQKNVLQCPTCAQHFSREFHLKKHIRTMHSAVAENSLGAAASVCGAKTTGSGNDTAAASATVTATAVKRVVMCEMCGESFRQLSSLKQHVQQRHSEPRLECTICSKRFHRMDVYSNHLLSHGAASIPCPECGKKLKTKKSLAIHQLQHSGDKRYACDLCSKRFLQRSNMVRHRRTHQPSDTTTASTMKKSSTTVECPVECSVCQKSFQRTELMTRHLVQQHTGKVHTCPHCGRIFKHRNSVRRHLRRTHQQTAPTASKTAPLIIPDPSGDNPDAKSVESKNVEEPHLGEDISVLLMTDGNEEVVGGTQEQHITLGKNAFILDDGTIVQPHDQGNIMFYVFEQHQH